MHYNTFGVESTYFVRYNETFHVHLWTLFHMNRTVRDKLSQWHVWNFRSGAVADTSSTTTSPTLLIRPCSSRLFTKEWAFSMVAMYRDLDFCLLIGGKRPLLPAYSSTRKPSSTARAERLRTWKYTTDITHNSHFITPIVFYNGHHY